VIPEHVLHFVRRYIKSVWTLDVLMLMRRERTRRWTLDLLAQELRGNRPLVQDVLTTLVRAGLLGAEEDGTYRYSPGSSELDETAAELERNYAERPLALIKEIVSAPNEKIQSFADAFRIKKD
jgi:DNA-binding IclR family transcriptional regulator